MTSPVTYRKILATLDENIWRGLPEIAETLDPDMFQGWDGMRYTAAVGRALEQMIAAGWVERIERQSDSYLRTPKGTERLNERNV